MSAQSSERVPGTIPPPPPSSPPPPDLRIVRDDPVILRPVILSAEPTEPPPSSGRPPRPPQSAQRPGAARPSRPGQHPQQRPATGLRLADKRGLTGLGAVALVTGIGAVAAAIDGHRSGNGLSWFFAVMFALACVAASLYVHSEDLGAVAIMPPLVFLVAAFVCAAFRPSDTGMPFTAQLRNEFLIALLLGAPGLFLAEALTLLTTGLRGARLRAVARQRRQQQRRP